MASPLKVALPSSHKHTSVFTSVCMSGFVMLVVGSMPQWHVAVFLYSARNGFALAPRLSTAYKLLLFGVCFFFYCFARQHRCLLLLCGVFTFKLQLYLLLFLCVLGLSCWQLFYIQGIVSTGFWASKCCKYLECIQLLLEPVCFWHCSISRVWQS